VLVLDDGQVLEYGNRKALLADPESRFYHLHQTGLEEVLA
jgi:ABC-type multidrug transport system fused ATPase/permease subunit